MIETPDKFVVVGDRHGDVATTEAVFRTYGDIFYLGTGDLLDGPDPCGVLERFVSVGGRVVGANHEQFTLAAMLEREDVEGGEERRRDNSDMWAAIHNGTLESYGIYSGPTPGSALRLRDKMDELGHLALLRDAPLYIETDELVILHANVTDEPWEQQRAVLNAEKARNLSGRYWGWSEDRMMPPQLGELKGPLNPDNLSASGLKKTLISGHYHVNSRNLDEHIRNNGQHLLLAGGHLEGFAVVYESWTRQLRLIEV